MALIKPFRGLRYDPEKIDDMERVLTPPYDVISPEEQEAFYQKSPYNMVRLDCGKIYDRDDRLNNRYTRASTAFETWQREAVLLRDVRPAMYVYHVTYCVPGGGTFARKGFFSLVRVEDFSTGIIKPHEKTFPKVTSDRLQLIEHCSANFSPVFALYSDPGNQVMEVLEGHREEAPCASFYDWAGLKHEMWAVTDERALIGVQKILEKETIFIADGHHRYTTALEYRHQMQAKYPNYSEHHAFNYIMMYLCSMEDKGLVVLPTHRVITPERAFSTEEFLEKAAGYFELERLPLAGRDKAAQAEEVVGGLKKAGFKKPAVGLYTGLDDRLYLLNLKKGMMREVFGASLSEPLRELDVVVLTELIFGRLLGLRDNISREVIRYYHNAREAMEVAARDDKSWAFLLNPTRIEQVKSVALAGLVMPHKSTYFYPKVLTGLVINKIIPEEEV